jgi:hypothetical protein
VMVTFVDLVSLTFILHHLSQCWIANRSVWRSSQATAGSLSVVRSELSSAKVAARVLGAVESSAV